MTLATNSRCLDCNKPILITEEPDGTVPEGTCIKCLFARWGTEAEASKPDTVLRDVPCGLKFV